MSLTDGSVPQLERFEIRRRMGGGSLGTVYEALDEVRQEVVAIKCIVGFSDEDRQRMRVAFDESRRLVHRNLVGLHEVIAHGDMAILVMELVSGVRLDHHLAGLADDTANEFRVAQPGEEPAQIVVADRLRRPFAQILSGTAALHATGRLHNNLKPTNVLVTRGGRVVITDSGLITEHRPLHSQLSRASHLLDGVPFLSPEQCRGDARLGYASDVYAIGALLYDAIAGRPPFDQPNIAAMLMAKQFSEPPDPAEVAPGAPKYLSALCQRMLHRDASERPTIDQILIELGEAPTGFETPPLPLPDHEVDPEEEVTLLGGGDALYGERVSRVSEGAHGILVALSLAGQPLPVDLCGLALPTSERAGKVAELLEAGLLRRTDSVVGQLLDVANPQVLNRAQSKLTVAERRDWHSRLADAMAAANWDDPAALVTHYVEAVRPKDAAKYAKLAAEAAAEEFDWSAAADFYGRALELGGWPSSELEVLRLALADALVGAGRSDDAALVFLDIANDSGAQAALGLRVQAAIRLLGSARLDDGVRLLLEVAQALGVPSSLSARDTIEMKVLRTRLRWLGANYEALEDTGFPTGETLRIDCCWLLSLIFSLTHPGRVAVYQRLNLKYAAKLGEPRRLARALAMDKLRAVLAGATPLVEGTDLLRKSLAQVPREQRARADAEVALTTGLAAFKSAQFSNALEKLTAAEDVFDSMVDAPLHFAAARLYRGLSMLYLGRIGELARVHGEWLLDADQRGNSVLIAGLRSGPFSLLRLARGEKDGVRRDILVARTHRAESTHAYQQVSAVRVRMALLLFEDRGRDAWPELQRKWPSMVDVVLNRDPFQDVVMRAVRGQVAIATGSSKLRPEAIEVGKHLEKSGHPLGPPLGHLILASAQAADWRETEAKAHLREAIKGFDTLDMGLHAAVCRYRLGGLRSDKAATAKALEEIERRGVTSAEGICRVLAPWAAT